MVPMRTEAPSPADRPALWSRCYFSFCTALPVVVAAMSLSLSLAHGPANAVPWRREAPSPVSEAVTALLASHGAKERPTALVVVRGDRLLAVWGEPARRVNVRSIRKSLLSDLYGQAIAEGRIRLDASLADLGIDDRPPRLSDEEKRATVRDLLMARSGVYHPAAYETGDMKDKRPPRGSRPPGTFWFYNNWDFNALGTIWERTTGEDVFAAVAQRIAEPIGMEDFSAKDGRRVAEAASDHPARVFAMSARDLARFGRLHLDRGRWDGRPVVPEAWIAEATTAHSTTDRGHMGYGYLWWTLQPDFGPGAHLASGYGGQAVAVLPAKRLVVVETVDLAGRPQGIRTSVFLELVRRIAQATPDP